MKQKLHKCRLILLSSVCIILFAKNSFAQQKSIADSIYTINEVNIEGKSRGNEVIKLKLPLKYVPISVSSISQKSFEQLGVDNVNDALKNMTGVNSVMTYGGFQTFYMRGFGSPVLMVDGQRDERMNYSSSAPIPDLTSVESIELLKGPASVLYGHSAVGGILNMVRKAPSEISHYNASASYGSWNSKRATFGSSGTIARNLSFRTDVGISDRDGWRDNNDKRFSAFFALAYQLHQNDRLEARIGFVNDFYGTETGIPTVSYDVFRGNGSLAAAKNTIPSFISREQRFNDPADFLKNKNANASLKYLHHFSENLVLSNTVSYFNDDIDYFSTEKLSYLTSSDPIYDTYYEYNGTKIYICLDTLQRTSPLRFSHMTATYQNQLEAIWQTRTGRINHHITGGWSVLYLNRTTYTGYNYGVDVYGPGYLAKIPTVDPVLNQGALLTRFSKANPRRDFTNGIYVQDLAEITDKIKVMLAGRVDFFRYETAGSVNTTNGTRKCNRDSLDWNRSGNTSFTYRAGIVYLPVKSISLFGSFSTFFKPYRDVFNQNYIYVNKDGNVFEPKDGEEIFKPESGYQGEIGFRCDIAPFLRMDASTFYIRKENIRENLATVTVEENGQQVSKKVYAQVGVVNAKGFDLELQCRLFKTLALDAGYTFTDAEYGDFKSNPYVESDSRKGNYQVYSPRHMGYAAVYYIIEKGTFKNLALGVNGNFSGETFTNATNTVSMPGYAVAGCSIGYMLKNNIKVHYYLKNITDKTYYEWALGNTQFIPSPGRNHLVSLSYSF
jgi:iron complex outermembrane recepter protein